MGSKAKYDKLAGLLGIAASALYSSRLYLALQHPRAVTCKMCKSRDYVKLVRSERSEPGCLRADLLGFPFTGGLKLFSEHTWRMNGLGSYNTNSNITLN